MDHSQFVFTQTCLGEQESYFLP